MVQLLHVPVYTYIANNNISSTNLRVLGVTGGTLGMPVSFGVTDCLSDQYTTRKLLVISGLELEELTPSLISNCRPKVLIVVDLEMTSVLFENRAACAFPQDPVSSLFLKVAVIFGFDGLVVGEEEEEVARKPWESAFKEGRFLRCRFFNRTLAR